MVGELGGEAVVGDVVLGDDDEAARVLVEPVDDPRPPHAADAGQAGTAMGDEGVDEGPAGMARCRVDDEAGGFVDDDEIVVLIGDDEIHGFRFRHRIGGRRHVEDEPRPGGDLGGRIAQHAAVAADMAFADEVLQPRTRQVGEEPDEGAVETLAALVHDADTFLSVLFHPRSPVR